MLVADRSNRKAAGSYRVNPNQIPKLLTAVCHSFRIQPRRYSKQAEAVAGIEVQVLAFP
jgi:hypothetical protein